MEASRRTLGNALVSLVALLMGIGSVGAASAGEDIVGLRIGMSLEEARQALQQVNKNFKLAERRDGDWSAPMIEASAAGERIIIKFTATQPKAFFIGRSVAFQPGRRPTKENLRKDLIDKYGTPTTKEFGRPWGDSLSWSASTPKEYYPPKSNSFRGCAPFNTGEEQWSAEAGTAQIFLYRMNPECDKFLDIKIGSDFNENASIAGSLSVSMTNFSLYRADPKNPNAVAANAERRKIEDARTNKPKI